MASQPMDLQRASDVLGLTIDKLDNKSIRSAYLTYALRYHPDKNPHGEKHFIEVNEAYEFLNKYLIENNEECNIDGIGSSYSDLLSKFIHSIAGVSVSKESLSQLFNGMRTEYDKMLCNAISGMKREDAILVYGYVSKFKDIIGINNDIVSSLETIVKTKMELDELIVIRPTFSQLFEPNIFPLEFEGDNYYVPLWHDEVEFDVHGRALIVRVSPELPRGISIDDNGCVIVEKKVNIKNLLTVGYVDIDVGPETIRIFSRDILVKPIQTLIFKGRGIIQMDNINILNANTRGAVRVRLELI